MSFLTAFPISSIIPCNFFYPDPLLPVFLFLFHLSLLLIYNFPLCLCFAVLADNLKSNPGIKWQYFSSEEGIFTVFPAHKFHCKGSYEHRSRYKATLPFFCCDSVVGVRKGHNSKLKIVQIVNRNCSFPHSFHPLLPCLLLFLTPPSLCQLLWGGPEGMLMACCPHTP